MRWLVLCTFVLCIASSALAVDTGNKFVMPVKDGIGDGMSDGREGTDCVKKSVIAMFNSMRTWRDQR